VAQIARRLGHADLHRDPHELRLVDAAGHADPDRQVRAALAHVRDPVADTSASKQSWLMMSVAMSAFSNIALIVSSSGIRWWLSG